MIATNGFKVLPLQFSSESAETHEIFFKEHSIRTHDPTKPAGKTLFILNVPPYATEDGLKNAFVSCDTIKSVSFQKSDKPQNGFKSAYIVFEQKDSLKKALLLDRLELLSPEEAPMLTGLKKWMRDYNSSIYNHETLNSEVTSFMAKYDKEEEEKKLNEKQVDEDDEGWTVVTKNSRNPGISRKESVVNKVIQKNKEKTKKKELTNFYRFQLKDQKMNKIIALRKSYEESKEKVKAMKQLRNFKPL